MLILDRSRSVIVRSLIKQPALKSSIRIWTFLYCYSYLSLFHNIIFHWWTYWFPEKVCIILELKILILICYLVWSTASSPFPSSGLDLGLRTLFFGLTLGDLELFAFSLLLSLLLLFSLEVIKASHKEFLDFS